MSTAFKTELAHQTSVKEVTDFDKEKLKKVETQEKNPLPDKDGEMPPAQRCILKKTYFFTINLWELIVDFFDPAIAAEGEHNRFKASIETFDKEKLAHADTVEKNPLPTKEVIEQEKSA